MGAGETPGAEEWVVTPAGGRALHRGAAAASTRPARRRLGRHGAGGARFLWAGRRRASRAAPACRPRRAPAADAGAATAATDDGGSAPTRAICRVASSPREARGASPSPRRVDAHAAVDPCRSDAERAESSGARSPLAGQRERRRRRAQSPNERPRAPPGARRLRARRVCDLAAPTAPPNADDADAVRRAKRLRATVPAAPRDGRLAERERDRVDSFRPCPLASLKGA